MKITVKKIINALTDVMDPEIHISIVDLGLIYKVTLKKDAVHILMTLTTIGCPLFSQIEMEMKQKLTELGFKDENIKLELTFDPPWSLERMSERGKALMGI
ncbi:metal-sulfur cluster assembly factor [Candidatus Roizmanbacteria bacterium]|nr:metal-sulfur cluster assembly factor [Candidatus Roizmanbacteria bacterium]